MDAIHSWIDIEEVSKLAEKLSHSPDQIKDIEETESDDFAILEKQGDSIETKWLADEEEMPQELPKQAFDKQRSMLAGASKMAKASGLIYSEKKPAIVDEVKTQESETVLEQIPSSSEENTSLNTENEGDFDDKGTFVMVQELYKQQVNDAGLCVIDRDGDILYDSFNNMRLSQFITNVMKTSCLMNVEGEEVGSLRIKHSATEVIEFLSVQCTRGVILVAARLSKGLVVEQRQKIAQDLRQILNAN